MGVYFKCNSMNPDIQRKVHQFETYVNDVLRADLAKLEQKLNAVNSDLAEFIQLKSVITTLQQTALEKQGFKTKVDMGQGFFMQAKVPNASTIFLDVGLGHYVEFTLDEAMVVINVRIKLFNRQIEHLRKEVARTNAHIKTIIIGIRDLQEVTDRKEIA